MKANKRILSIIFVTVLSLVILMFPLSAAATNKVEDATIPASTSNNVPPPSDISENSDFSEGFTNGMQLDSAKTMSSRSGTVNGTCSITKNSSTKITVSGSSICSPSDPSLKVALSLQAYYNGAWHTLKTKVKSTSGTYVSLTQAYYVTSGYYYRVRKYHSMSDGTSNTSYTGAVWVG